MKLTTLLLIISLFKIHANTYSQSKKITLNVEDATIKEVFYKIEDLSDFRFLYNQNKVDVNRKVSLKAYKKPISDILDSLFSETDIYFKVKKKQIILKEGKPKEKNNSTNNIIQETITVTGTVTEVETGMPVPAANILEKGTSNGVMTDFDGNYTIDVPKDAILQISYIGYGTKEVSINGRNEIDIVLEADAAALDEVVLVGYGTQKITSITSAVSSVDVEELGEVTSPNIVAALQGRTPGLYIKDAGYNQGMSVRVRGTTTIGNNSPLYIVDGVPQDLLSVDPNDIEAISVLKDGAASAIYGSRAAAGVIIVQTKSGKNRKVSFNFDSYVSFGNLTTEQKSINSIQSATIMNEASLNSGGQVLFSPEDFAKFESGTDPAYPNTDWKEEFLKTEVTNRYFLSARGGNERTSYYFSLGYRNADGIVKSGIDNKQYNIRSNLKTKLRDNIDLDVNLSYSVADNTAPNVNSGLDNIYQHVNSTAPFVPVRNTDGEFEFFNQAGAYARGFWNPLWELEAGTSNTKTKIFTANSNLTWELMKGLKVIGRYSLISRTSRAVSSIYKRSTTGGPSWFSDINSLGQTWRDNNQYNAQTFISYDKVFDKHSLGVLAGWDVQFNKDSFISASRRSFQFDNLLTEFDAPNSGDNDDITGLSSNTGENALQSGVGRISYDYDEKYFLELTGRYDGSSIFAPENRYGFFPSASAGWMISKEDFLSSNSIDQLKLRASYGTTGNNRVSGSYFSTIAFGTYYFGAGDIVEPTVSEGGVPFRDLKWETTKTINFGLDFTLYKGLLSGSVDYYIKDTEDILLPSPVPGTVGTGRSGPPINAGNVQNKGIELVINHTNSFPNGLRYGVSINTTFNNNEITELTDAFSEFDTNYRVGDALGSVYGYESGGILSSQAEVDAYKAEVTSGISPNTSMGDIRYIDQNKDGVLDFEDNVVIAETVPQVYYGVNLNAAYKNFDVQVFFQGTAKSQDYRSNDLFGNYAWIPEEATDAWSATNTDGTYPRLLLFGQQTYSQNFNTTSSFWAFNSSYLRLKNLQLGYTLPIKGEKYINKARLYFTGTNLWTVSDFRPGFDPESSGLGIPPLKTYSLGVNIKF
ncbi:TonB-dependent receptor [Antarcticibacterium sp. 1MA-6-2]|uniref:TonB-dependent receptor n=1 Tax=Antarcticibacterium sp. 1MA-6-2 TaxID=2908210 RepID=UPI001F3ECE01|nr:TonB-dependent receptor [Antarcticibacterium sp. 1MA-6-2]UJH92693.1 TonB-dependent receptor [Antarcticibacterium sp. 1MA-6-2]